MRRPLRSNGLVAWAKHAPARHVYKRLVDAPDHIVRAATLAAWGAPVSSTDAARAQVVVAMVADKLARVRVARDPLRALSVLVDMLAEVDHAFARFEPDASDVRYLQGSQRGARRVGAWLLRRAGACGIPKKRAPTEDEIRETMNALKLAAHRARGKGLRES